LLEAHSLPIIREINSNIDQSLLSGPNS